MSSLKKHRNCLTFTFTFTFQRPHIFIILFLINFLIGLPSVADAIRHSQRHKAYLRVSTAYRWKSSSSSSSSFTSENNSPAIKNTGFEQTFSKPTSVDSTFQYSATVSGNQLNSRSQIQVSVSGSDVPPSQQLLSLFSNISKIQRNIEKETVDAANLLPVTSLQQQQQPQQQQQKPVDEINKQKFFQAAQRNEQQRRRQQQQPQQHRSKPVIDLETDPPAALTPIILVPGLEGSQLLAKLHKNHSEHIYCWRRSDDYFNIWLNMEELVEPMVNCFVDNMRLNYNASTRTTSNQAGVDVHVPGFGHTHTIENLSPSRLQPKFNYFGSIVESVLTLNYTRGTTVRGAPFDFRKAPNEMDKYLKKLQSLIETTVKDNLGKPAVIVCHSMGCLFSINLLNVRVNDGWKKKYVKALYTISAPWSGAFKALKTLTTGDNMGIFIYSGRGFREMEQSFPSITFLLPSPYSFDQSRILVQTPVANYTLRDYQSLFEDMGVPDVYHMQQDTSGLLGNLKHPGVDVYCVYGTGLKTATQLQYDKDQHFPDKPRIMYSTDGDSTVNLASLEACLRWNQSSSNADGGGGDVHGKHKYHFETLKLDNADHLDILHDERMLQHLQDTIQAIQTSS